MAELKAHMKSITSGMPRIDMQALQIADAVKSWVKPANWDSKQRNSFPFKVTADFTDDSFQKFMQVRRLKADTRTIYMLAMSRVAFIVEPVDGSELDVPNIALNIFRSKLFEQLQDLPALAEAHSPTRQIVVALGHYSVMTKLRFQAAGDGNAAQMVDNLIEGVLVPWGKRCSFAASLSSDKRYLSDGLLIAAFHTPQKLNSVAFNQYMELISIHNAVVVQKTHILTHMILFKATACVIQGFYTNGPPSRSMELQTLPRLTIDDFLNDTTVDYFTYSNYKTFHIYGKGGKIVFDANRKAFALYREIVDSNPGLYLDADPEVFHFFQRQKISVASCLRAVSASENLEPPLKVNLCRKVYAVWAKTGKTTSHIGDEKPGELFAMVARNDKHGLKTADKIYAALTPAEDARLARHCFNRLMGQPVEFPTNAEWEEQGRPLDEIMLKIKHVDTTCEDDEEDEDMDCLAAENEVDDDQWDAVLHADTATGKLGATAKASPKPKVLTNYDGQRNNDLSF